MVSMCTWRNVIFVTWWAPAHEHSVSRHGELLRRMVEAWPQGISVVHFTQDKVPLPEAPARAAFIQLIRDFSKHLACVGVVVGSGFWASAVRAMVTGMWLAVPQAFQLRICTGPGDLVSWLPDSHHGRTGMALPRVQLTQVVESAMRREHSELRV
jgi:hypothetical protein